MSLYIETNKLTEINYFHVYPGSEGSGIVVPGEPPVTIYRDPALETSRTILDGRYEELSYTLDMDLPRRVGYELLKRGYAVAEADTTPRRNTARFFEKLLQVVYEDDTLNLQHIKVGVSDEGKDYRLLGYSSSRLRAS